VKPRSEGWLGEQKKDFYASVRRSWMKTLKSPRSPVALFWVSFPIQRFR